MYAYYTYVGASYVAIAVSVDNRNPLFVMSKLRAHAHLKGKQGPDCS